MKRRTWSGGLLILSIMATVTMLGCSYHGEGPGPGGQPYMRNALSALQEARQQLVQAVPDKGGHRVQAINLVDQAINQVELGIQFAGD